MPLFRYTALDGHGKLVKGTLVALTESDAERRLSERDLTLIQAKKLSERFSFLSSVIRRRVKDRDLIEFYQRLSESLEVGLPLLSTLEENIKLISSRRLARSVEQVKLDVENGLTLSQAMSQQPDVFDSLQIGIVAMGEQAGTLPEALKHLADFLEWKYQQKSLLKRASIYPAFIFTTVLIVVSIWVGYVLPQVGGFLQSMQIELPTVTKIVIKTSRLIQNNWVNILIGLIIFVVTFILVKKSKWGGIKYDQLMLKLPIVGRVVLNSCISRIGHYFAVMLEAGMTLVTIFELMTDGIIGNKYIEIQLAEAFEHIKQGKQFFEAFKKGKSFPDLFLGAIKTGEQAGKLADTFKRLGVYYDKEVKRSVKFLLAAFEPAIIIFLGVFFGIIILAILSPLYDVISQVGKAY